MPKHLATVLIDRPDCGGGPRKFFYSFKRWHDKKKTLTHPMLKQSERKNDGGLSPCVAVKEAEIFLADPCVEPLCLGSSLICELVNLSGCHVFIFPSKCPFINLWLFAAPCLKTALHWLTLLNGVYTAEPVSFSQALCLVSLWGLD